MFRKRTLSFLLVFMMAASLLTGCGTQESSLKIEKNELLLPLLPVTKPIEGQPKIFVISKIITNDYWQRMEMGMTFAGADLKANVYLGGCQDDQSWEIQEYLIYQALEAGADAILLAPTDEEKLSEACEAVRTAHVPLLIIDSEPSFLACNGSIHTDNYAAGMEAGKQMIALLKNSRSTNEKLSIYPLITGEESITMKNRERGLREYWVQNAPSNWTMQEHIVCTGVQSQAREILDSKCAGQGGMQADGIVSLCTTGALGLAGHLEEHPNPGLAVVTIDYLPQVAELMRSSEYQVTSLDQDETGIGYRAIEMANRLVNRKPLTPKDVIVPFEVVTQESLEEYEMSIKILKE